MEEERTFRVRVVDTFNEDEPQQLGGRLITATRGVDAIRGSIGEMDAIYWWDRKNAGWRTIDELQNPVVEDIVIQAVKKHDPSVSSVRVALPLPLPLPSIILSPSACEPRRLVNQLFSAPVTAHPLVLSTTLDLFGKGNGRDISPAAVQVAGDWWELISRFQSGLDLCGPFAYCNATERELTSILAPLLQRYLLSVVSSSSSFESSPATFLCCHQGSAVASQAAVDILIYAAAERVLLPTVFFEVSIAGGCSSKVTQAAAYANNLAHHMRVKQQEPLLVLGVILSCLSQGPAYEVHAYVGFTDDNHQRMLDIVVQEKNVSTALDFSYLFDSLFRWSQSRIRNIADVESACLPRNNALVMDGHVFKSFTPSDVRGVGRRPDFNLQFVPGATLVIDSDKLKLLKYPYVEGTHVASSVGHFLSLFSILQEVHSNQVVHGDIRESNVIFVQSDPVRSNLIDFDMSGRWDAHWCYPEKFRIDVNDGQRHPGAKPFAKMEIVHDYFALAYIMSLYSCEHHDHWNGAISALGLGKLQEAYGILKPIENASLTRHKAIIQSAMPSIQLQVPQRPGAGSRKRDDKPTDINVVHTDRKKSRAQPKSV